VLGRARHKALGRSQNDVLWPEAGDVSEIEAAQREMHPADASRAAVHQQRLPEALGEAVAQY
ncbi:MAG: hypothetical protein WBZ25_04360, partial [Pseudolabrys sp.]